MCEEEKGMLDVPIVNPKNVIVQYKGGGYDGCIWEMNYALFDADGKYIDVYSSGVGAKCEKETRDLVEHGPGRYDEVWLYKLDQEGLNALRRFEVTTAFQMMTFLIESEECNIGDWAPMLRCSECGEYFDEFILENWHGIGGIKSTADLLLCPECYLNGVCERCGCWYDDLEGSICKYCREEEDLDEE